MKNLKTTMIAALLIIMASSLVAQDKYDFATVSYLHLPKKIRISINGEFEAKGVEGSKDVFDYNPLFKEVAALQDKGWEVYNVFESAYVGLTFVLRKKKQ
jgi:hypothetical protein